MSPSRETVRFPSADGTCVGDLLLPGERPEGQPRGGGATREGAGPEGLPTVVMAAGIGAERSFGLAPFAERFVARGLAALVFDFRTFGDSPGQPRNLVSPPRHVDDYLAALDFVRRDERLDGGRVGLWGTSFSGGHAVVAAAREPDAVSAVVAQVPFLSGIASALRYPLRHLPAAVALATADAVSSLVGRPPVTVPVVRERGGPAVVHTPDAWEGYRKLAPDPATWEAWEGRVPARILLTILVYRPLGHAARVRAPTLLVAGRDDRVCPVGTARKAARRIPDARLEELPTGHFDVYEGEAFERAVATEADFLARHLGAGGRGVSGP